MPVHTDVHIDFRPSAGTLETFKVPSGPGVRVDSAALCQGTVVKPHYDPMLLKCITHSLNMADAVRIMLRALEELTIRGVETNIEFLKQILQCTEFLEGSCWTTFLQEFLPSITVQPPADDVNKLLHFLGHTVVNGTQIIGQVVSSGPRWGSPVQSTRMHTNANIQETARKIESIESWTLTPVSQGRDHRHDSTMPNWMAKCPTQQRAGRLCAGREKP